MGRILLSICAVVVAAGLGGLQQADQTGQADGGKADGTAQVTTVVVTPPQASTDFEDPGCERGQDDRTSDLCAQWKAADAARASANAAWWLGVVGLMVGGLTLWAASRAAHWAKEAAKHTEDGAKAGWAAEKVTRESSEHQLRAYVGINQVDVTEEDNRFIVAVMLKNFGQTPAKDAAFKTKTMYGDVDDPLTLDETLPATILMPNDRRQLTFIFGETAEDVSAIRDGTLRIAIRIDGTFTDAFGETRLIETVMAYQHIIGTFRPTYYIAT